VNHAQDARATKRWFRNWERFLSNSYEEASELELARLARDGEESAFAEIMRRYSPRVFRVASRFFRQRSLVEEAAQEVFLKAFAELDGFEGRGSMEGWLTRIATNTCLNLLRSAKRRPELTVSDLTEDDSKWLDSQLADAAGERHRSSERSLVAADLAGRVLQGLAPDDQLVLTMIDGEDLSVKDVAQATGWSEAKVKVRAFRARRRMRAAVEKLLGGGTKGGASPATAGS
jgi:RNA polymerase sigma-70 factor (ECF subfamily)